ncbi:peptidase domain-containing ABC transporter [Planktothrix sp. FACHB-1355]|uniref:Peptidase domain-containing ABC transporter n=1 Tax=Aerosakkonema funiforme FACHB-1375 TaxID=2949571 RepID=A0A926VH67_9CYAN|nr:MULTISPECIES: peptidase domain-containing ABC transporter [Oscillatoriales]MBD2183820.1 peptidase domain-containing ABC transporter [Aerosakkonema funiforme FACHB-1375]MBD3558287.1 peptidase domain-containing ABC transporter [Planktothrix sp. FACHB-1355]
MTQAVSRSQIQTFLAEIEPFKQLSPKALQALAAASQLLRYRIGQTILQREIMPTQVAIVYIGQVRLLGYDQRNQTPTSLQVAGPGEVLGWVGLVRGVACETAIASNEVICITIPASVFLSFLDSEPVLAQAFKERPSRIELFELLSLELQRRALGNINLKDLTFQVWQDTEVLNLPNGQVTLPELDQERVWLVSSGFVGAFSTGSRFPANESGPWVPVKGKQGARLLGVRLPVQPSPVIDVSPPVQQNDSDVASDGTETGYAEDPDNSDIPYAPDLQPESQEAIATHQKLPYYRGRGTIDAPLACFKMLAKYMGLSFRKDVIRKVLDNQIKTRGNITLLTCGGVTEMMGMKAQLVQVHAQAITRLKAPAMVEWQDSFAIIYSISAKELVIATPEEGIRRRHPREFVETWGNEGQVLLLEKRSEEQQEKFSLRWFLPAISKYRKTLIEVFIASFLVQLFALANPLATQVIIDQVIKDRSATILHSVGLILLVVAVFEALLTYVRTTLFVDTTNRIDVSLGAEVIDHLVRLPLNYFDNRRVGELAGRVNELENIRQFLTGTALTVVLDAFFSVFYIAFMLVYSVPLTFVALSTIPLFALLTFVVAPIVQRQLRTKAERHADSQSYLVEVLSGIQTVKAQNIELKSRWQWQEKYARYIKAGFKTVLTFSTASALSGFFNKLSSLLLLWVGAYMVIATPPQLTLGQLIAFRIIAGYVTSPLLRLVQLWQNFQETALSIERLSDVLDAKPEADENNRHNIAMPPIEGAVRFENVSFRFNTTGPLQLVNVSVEFPAGTFVGIVGQSGSGKSTLMKLLQRLYEPVAGRIQVDDYDIAKVELYSLRRQIGMVLQDTLLFNGTIRENIALTNPEASDEEIIEAAKVAVAHDFIMGLSNGYNTIVGERGSGLSGGQRQRIAIARSVLQNPKMLILDEATSALDYHSERQVCENLAVAFQGRTVFFITHRLSTVKSADVILMMDQGCVVEQGTHKELMALKGRYYCLYQQQESEMS